LGKKKVQKTNIKMHINLPPDPSSELDLCRDILRVKE